VAKDPAAGFGDVIAMLFQNNAAVASGFFGRQLGVLAEGAAADVIVIDHVPFTPATPDNVYGHILFGAAAGRVTTTICDGRVLMRDCELTMLDYEEICAEAAARTPATWRRFAKL
jgi:cytosine/adenosine deaminase-related metal-dependent hydrolase